VRGMPGAAGGVGSATVDPLMKCPECEFKSVRLWKSETSWASKAVRRPSNPKE
jgi:hypothetical protein